MKKFVESSRRFLGVVFFALFFSLCFAAWQSEIDVSDSSISVAPPIGIAIDDSGNAAVVWQQTSGTPTPVSNIEVSNYLGTSSTWSTQSQLSSATLASNGAGLVADSAGNMMAVWSTDEGNGTTDINYSYYTSGVSWSSAATLASYAGSISDLQIAMDRSSGRALIAWVEGSTAIKASFYWGSWETPVSIVTGATSIESLSVAMGNSTEGVIAYNSSISGDKIVQAIRNINGNSSGWEESSTAISEAGHDATGVVLGQDSTGIVYVLWQRSNGTNTMVQCATYSVASWQSATDLSASGHDSMSPSIAMDPNGSVFAVWKQTVSGSNSTVILAKNLGSGWSTTDCNLSTPITFPQIATNGTQAIAGWVAGASDANASYFDGSSWSSVRQFTDTVNAVQQISVAINHGGAAFVGWIRTNDSSKGVLQAELYRAAQTITFNSLADKTYGDGSFSLSASASSNLAVTYTVSGPATLSGNTVSLTGVGTVSVTAHQVGNSTYAPATNVTQSFTVNPAVLTVTADDKTRAYGASNPSLTYTVTGFQLSDDASVITGSVGLSTTANSGSSIGDYTITTDVSGLTANNYTFTAVNGTLHVETGQTISFALNNGVTKTYGAAPFDLSTISTSSPDSTSNLAIVFSIISGPATISGTTITITGAGTVVIAADQPGDSTYAPAARVTQNLTVNKALVTVTADNKVKAVNTANPTFTYSTSGFVNGDTFGSVAPGTPSLTTTASTNSALGDYDITTDVSGLSADSYSFTGVNGTLHIELGQTITFNLPGSYPTTVGSHFDLTATSDSGLTVTLSVVSGNATISGNTLTITGVGAIVIGADQAGNGTYAPADQVTQGFTATIGDQTITFGSIADQVYGHTLDLTGTATCTSGLTITYSYVSGPASLSGTTLTFTGIGTVVIAADQAGDSNYNAATEVTKNITVGKAVLTVTADNKSRVFGVSNPSFTDTITGYQFSDDASVITGSVGLSTTASNSTDPGSYTITTDVSGLTADNYSFTPVNGTLTINKANQTITFGSISSKIYGHSYDLSATSDSNLGVSFTVASGPATLGVNGHTLTFTGVGTVVVHADQAGNTDYNAASQVSQSITVNPAVLTVTAVDKSRAYGASNPTLTDTITGYQLTDDASVITGSVGLSTAADNMSGVGNYAITTDVSGLTAANYTVRSSEWDVDC